MRKSAPPTKAEAQLRVLVVDDHRSFSESLATVIDLQPDLESAGVAATVEEALQRIKARPPDVVLMDIHLPDADGIEGTRRVYELLPNAHVVVLTAHTTLDNLARAADAGAHGFIPKEVSVEELLRAVRSVPEGGMLVERSTLSRILAQAGQDQLSLGSRPSPPALTPREREVLALMGEGHDPSAIARELAVSTHTARGHVKSILAKLGAHSQLQAVVLAVREGLLPAITT